MKIAVTGGAGFIGSELVRQLCEAGNEVVVVDKLTYAANLASLPLANSRRCRLERIDVCDGDRLREFFIRFEPQQIYHLAAESHVDRSIAGANVFVQTNVVGTLNVLEAARALTERGHSVRTLHVSTDEVYGTLADDHSLFKEDSPYLPNSPYAASKAGSDHLARAWHRTYKLPVIITHCSNNYGPWQHAEKLIPLMIERALLGEPLPVYGRGHNIRDWLHVSDHARGLQLAMEKGLPGEVYNFGGGAEIRNLDLVHKICAILDEIRPRLSGRYADQITFVPDRLGHDFRYGIDTTQTQHRLNWRPRITFEEGLRSTVIWYCRRFDERHHSGRGRRNEAAPDNACHL
jgi:dTDP-glucose 4,6-dehydratase